MANDTFASMITDVTGWPVPAPPTDIIATVDRVLTDFLDAEASSLTALDRGLAPLVDAARHAVLGGGKRLRPTFAYWGWRGAVGPGPAVEPVLPALAALELLHAFALVHDDIMDGSPTRRGLPTAHRALACWHDSRSLTGDPRHFGTCAAILVGDLCLVWADRLAGRAHLPAATYVAARRGYDRMRVEAIAGQFLDLLGESAPAWSVERALRTARLKTASYTVVRPLAYGAALGDSTGDGPLTHAYARYGYAVGEAFQLRDDLLGVYGDPLVTGKPVGEDLARGKPTVLVELGRTMATGTQAAELATLLERRGPEDLLRLAALLRDTGAPARLGDMIAERIASALSTLDDAPIDAWTRDALAQLASTAAWRES